MEDFGIRASIPGVNVNQASVNDLIINTRYAQFKIDTQTDTGFQSILLLITNDPPEPVFPVLNTYTIIAQFAHGYDYIPAIETLFHVTSPPPGAVFTQEYFQDSGLLGAHTSDDAASIYTITDDENVYFVVLKNKLGGGIAQPNLLTGTVIELSNHIFVDDVGI